MRYTHLFVAAALLFSLPTAALAVETSGTGSGYSTESMAGAALPAQTAATLPAPTAASEEITITDDTANGNQSAVPGTEESKTQKEKISDAKIIKSRFQNYVTTSTGASLDVFGAELFRKVPSTYAPLGAVQVNADYLIGAGDVLQVRGWGMVDINVTATVNRNGEIYLPKVGSIQVAGVKYRDLQGHLKKSIGKIYNNFEISASIAQTRSVQIYVVGHAQRPGTYTLSSMSTLLNALFTSGGPSGTGSMRNIQLKRSGQPLVSFDLYDILLHGDKNSDIPLKDGDVIFIPAVGPLVALLGDVKKPAIFEIREKSSIAEIVNWAGGFESSAALKNVIIEKNVDNHYQTVAELRAESSSIETELSKFMLQPADIIRVFAPGAIAIPAKVERAFVRFDGEVKQKGVFQIEKGETLRAFVARTGITEKGYIYGTRLSRESVKLEQQKKIDESVDRFEKDIQLNAKQRLSRENDPKQIALITREQEAEKMLIPKLRRVKSEGRIILNIRNPEATITDLPDFPLEDGDEVYIPLKLSTIDVVGSVYQQNTFMFEPERSANDYLMLAGGVSASGDSSEMYRICANGTIQSKRHGGMGGYINPGDALVVPEKIERGGRSFMAIFMENLQEWTTILYQFGLGAAALKTIRN